MTFGSDLAHLARRIERAIEAGRSIQLSATDLDMLTAIGVYELISAASAAELRSLAEKRLKLPHGHIPNASDSEAEPKAVPMPNVYTPATLAQRWGVSSATVYGRIKSGELAAFRLGGTLYRIKPEAVLDFETSKANEV